MWLPLATAWAEPTLRVPPPSVEATMHADAVVCVTVGADGRVTDAVFVEGPAALRQAAVQAAREAIFEPPEVGGVRVDLQVHFAPAASDVDDHDADFEVVVEHVSLEAANTHAAASVGPEELERKAGQGLAEAIAGVPGVTVGRGTAGAGKPIVRGHVERRLLVLFDGVRHASQNWGVDHATEIDPFAAGAITVVRGASGVRHGPDAIGGVVLVEPPPLRDRVGVGGKALMAGASNGLSSSAALRLDGVAAKWPAMSGRVEGNVTRAASMHTPDYVLGNTARTLWNAGATLGLDLGRVRGTLAARHYDLDAGICFCAAAESAEDFAAGLLREEPLGAETWTTSFAVARPRQAVRHDLVLARADVDLRRGALQATYAFQSDRRLEYDVVRDDIEGPQYDFLLRTHSLDLWWGHDHVPAGVGHLSGGVGAQGSFQENVYGGLPLVPNYRVGAVGVLGVERWTVGRVAVELGGRLDQQVRTAYLTESALQRDVGRGLLDASDCALADGVASCPGAHRTGSASLGGIARVGDVAELRLDLSSASRFPSPDELYMNGSAPTSPVYAVGDPSLGVETTWGLSPTVAVDVPAAHAEVSTFTQRIDDYVAFGPSLAPDGTPGLVVTVQGAFPSWEFRAVDAVFYGLDGSLALGPEAVVGVELAGAVVRGLLRGTTSGLAGVPPDTGRLTVVARPAIRGLRASSASASATWIGQQDNVDPAQDLAPPPEGVWLLGASVEATRPLAHGRTLTVGLLAENLLDARHRLYTSLLRYAADEPGRDVRARITLDF